MLSFWATWLRFRRAERSTPQTAHERYRDQGSVLLYIDTAEARDAAAQMCRVRAVPHSMFIDRQGDPHCAHWPHGQAASR